MSNKLFKPDYLFETSWEVCNKAGGIHTILASKSEIMVNEFKDNYILIGPDVYKEESVSPEFIEDSNLFSDWREKALEEGLRLRVGRWNISGNPIVLLIDFTSLINKKDEIFSQFWETYKLDSLSGQWDYIEPSLFGYGIGKAIESFIRYKQNFKDRYLAHFHDWLTGTGILYLKHSLPQIATIFTAHSTIIGRTLAYNNENLYGNLSNFNPNEIAIKNNIVSKFSLEKLSALNADVFTTVSEITALECLHFLGKEVDNVTPNGIEESIIQAPELLKDKRIIARDKLTIIAEALLGYTLSTNPFFTAFSGRYEFRNKGLDIFIKVLDKLNQEIADKRDIVAFVMVPSNHYGPKKDLVRKINGECDDCNVDPYLTHNLHDAETDLILKQVSDSGLENKLNDRVKVIYVPCNIAEDDGLFNLNYHDLIPGFDLAIFPSYYEPWGNRPLECLAYSVPVILSSLSGFGTWIKKFIQEPNEAVILIERTGKDDDDKVVADISEAFKNIYLLDTVKYNAIKESTTLIAKQALWTNQVQFYYETYKTALEKLEERADKFMDLEPAKPVIHAPRKRSIEEPVWNPIIVQSDLPEKLSLLNKLADNLWWSWNYEAIELFEEINPEQWEECGYNPIYLLENTTLNRFRELEADSGYMEKLNKVYGDFKKYVEHPPKTELPKVAYFCMEYGLHSSLKIYSGGLGILAGDYLKEASDYSLNMVAVGLYYKFGYFKQSLSVNGDQQATYEPLDSMHIPIEKVVDGHGNWKTINIVFPGRTLTVGIWKVSVGRVPLYLLDTDLDVNTPQDRTITHNLYGGDLENRLKQEIVLGIGGIRALELLDIHPNVYHSNEGHSAFLGLERLKIYINKHKLSFDVAREVVRSSNLFTTHTPVPAGHDSFPEDLLRVYIPHYPERLKITWDELMNLGRFEHNNKDENFSMSVLAANLSQEMNGVSWLHGQVSREMFAGLYKGYLPEENHINYVTNGVHYYTWTAKEWRQLYESKFGECFPERQDQVDCWKKIHEVPNEKIWEIKQTLREHLISDIKKRYKLSWINRHEHPKHIVDIIENLDSNALTIGFARRFATYKRAGLLFSDLDKLSELINHPEKPIQFIFAGKAHPQDTEGQDLIKHIVQVSKLPQFLGKILFLQNYDMSLAQKLVAGVDIWLNTPTRPLEASGTSGEKAAMNGTMHFSVLDGWWMEGYQPNAGWALTEKRTYNNQDYQNELDAETIYHLLESEIVPAFYDRDKNDIPGKWIGFIKNTISDVAPKFTMRRMLVDYINKFYTKLHYRGDLLLNDDFNIAKDMALWKKMVSRRWGNVQVVSVGMPEEMKHSVTIGKTYVVEVILNLNKLLPEEIGIEFLFVNFVDGKPSLIHKDEFSYVKSTNGNALYSAKISPDKPGALNYAIRIFPKNQNLPHRQDFPLVTWA